MPEIKVKCPAKINLTLEILNKREDGFHNIQSVMQTIDLFDILTITIEKSKISNVVVQSKPDIKQESRLGLPSQQQQNGDALIAGRFAIKLTGTNDQIPYDERNLVYKAAELFMNALVPSPLVGEGGWKPDEGFKELMNERAKHLRNNLTKPEDVLWYHLRDRRFIDLKFRRQVPIKKYIADFICFEKKIIIELDGSQHFEEKAVQYDKKRDDFFKSQGFRILRFYNSEIFNNLEGVLEVIFLSTQDDNYIQPIESRERVTQTLNPLTPNPSPTEGRGEKVANPQIKPFSIHHSPIYPFTIHIHIEKNIPIAAGLAGGSTDAAGTLWGLNKLFDNVLSDKELHELCAQLGSDLNFCLEGGCQLATSRGEILKKLPFQEFNLSLIKPKNLGISAKEAYTKFSELKNKLNLNMTEKLVNKLAAVRLEQHPTEGERPCGACDAPYKLENFLHNDLEITLIEDYQELKQIKTAYPKSLMSGSGSTFFILEDNIKNISDDFWIKTGLKSIHYGVCED